MASTEKVVGPGPTAGRTSQDVKLTKREKEVVRLLMEDKSTKMIADEMGVDVHTSTALIAEVMNRGLLN